MAGLTQKIGRGLSAFGAGVAGQGQQFLKGLSDERSQAALDDAFTVQQQLTGGDVAGARQTLLDRLEAGNTLGGDMTDTLALQQKINSGDLSGALADVTTVVDFGVRSGVLKAPAKPAARRTQVVDGQLVDLDTGQATPLEGFDPNTQASQDRQASRELRERELALREQTEQRQATKLSAGLEKVLLTSQQSSIDRQGDAISFNTLAQEFETRGDELFGGVAQTVNESFKTLLGTQDDVTEFRRKINAIRVAEGIGQLPPGVASDKDIELVMSGQIRENASPTQVASYLRGAAKAAQYSAGYNQLRVDFINKNRKGAGLNQVWRKKFKSETAGRDVTTAEIYRTAMLRGMSTQEVLDALGIEGELF